MTITLESKIPTGPVADAWNTYKSDVKLVAPGSRSARGMGTRH